MFDKAGLVQPRAASISLPTSTHHFGTSIYQASSNAPPICNSTGKIKLPIITNHNPEGTIVKSIQIMSNLHYIVADNKN